MEAIINNISVKGTPEEVFQYQQLVNNHVSDDFHHISLPKTKLSDYVKQERNRCSLSEKIDIQSTGPTREQLLYAFSRIKKKNPSFDDVKNLINIGKKRNSTS